MKAKVLLSLVLLCGSLAAPVARAGDAAPSVPAAAIERVAEAVRRGSPAVPHEPRLPVRRSAVDQAPA